MSETAKSWWEISTARNSVLHVDDEEKRLIVQKVLQHRRGEGDGDQLIHEGTDVGGASFGLVVANVDAWWISTPETREQYRRIDIQQEDEYDEFLRRHERGKYKPKTFGVTNDE